MKLKPTAGLSSPLASAIAALFATPLAFAASLTWDNGAATGNWNTTDLNWTAVVWNNATPDDAIFGASGVGTVTLTEAITAGGIAINTAGYTITGNTITLNSGATALTSSATSAVNSNVTLATAAGTLTSSAGILTLGGTLDAGALALTFAGAGDTTLGNAISNGAALIKSGAGVLTLAGTSGFTSATINGGTIGGGTLTLSAGATALTSSATSAVNSNVTIATAAGTITSSAGTLTLGGTVDAGSLALTFAGAGNATVSNGVANGTSLTKSGTGTLIFGGTNTYSGATTISTGILQAGSITGLSPNSDISIASSTRLVLGGFNNTVGVLNGTGGVVENANAAPATLTLGNTNANGSYSSTFQDGTGGGALAVIKTGSGAQAITNGTFTGGLSINQGTWQLGGVNGLGNGPVALAAGAKLSSNSTTARTLTNVANTLAVSGSITLGDTTNTGALTLPGAITLSSSPTITVPTNNAHILSGVISGSSFTKAGAGSLTLSNALNSYSGGTIITGGTLAAATDAVLGNAAGGITFDASATMTPGSVTYARSVTVNNGAIASFNGSNPIFSGNLTGTGGVANANGFGNQVTFTGTGNTFEGQVRIGSSGTTGQAYRFQFSSFTDSATANGTIQFSASRVTHADGSVFQYNGTTNLILANRQIELASATGGPSLGHQIRNNGTGTLTINTNLLVNGGSPQTLALRGTNTGNNVFAGVISNSTVVGTTPLETAFVAAATTITLQSVQGITVGATITGTGIAGGTTITAINTGTRVVTLSAATSGTGAVGQIMTVPGVLNPTSVSKNTDAGTWTLSGNNTHSGGTSFSAGILNINHAGALGTGTLTIGAGTFNNTSGTAITNANNNAIAWNGDATFTGSNSLDLGTGAVTMGGNRNIVVSANTLTMGGAVSGAAFITLGGGGTLALTNEANSYTGKTSIGNNAASTLRLRVTKLAGLSTNSSLGAPTTAANGLIQIGRQSNSSILELTGGTSASTTNRQVSIGSAENGSGNATILNNNTNAAHTLTFSNAAFNVAALGTLSSTARTLTLGGTNTGDNTIQGTIINNFTSVGVAKTGAGTWVLAGANTYTGGTTVSAGTLVLANTSAVQTSSGVTVGGASATTLRLATDAAFTTLPQIGGASGAGGTTFVSDRATPGAGLTHALGSPNLGANTFNFTSGGNVTSGTAGIAFTAIGMTSGAAGTTVLNPTTAVLTIVGGVNGGGNNVARTLNLDGTGTGHSIGGAIADGIATAMSLVKSNTSTWTLSGTNTYTGTTTVSGGVLQIGASGVLPDTSNVILGAGSLDAATFTDAAGTLKVTAAGAVNLGLGATLAFANSALEDWTGGTLNITGTFVSGSSLRFGTDGSGLTPAQLALISKPGGGAVALNSSGYLIDAVTGGYAGWQTANSTAQAINLDHDNDGVSNGVEYFLGGNTNTTGFTPVPGVVKALDGTLSVTWTKAASYTGTYGTDFWVETSASLANPWTNQIADPAPGFTVTFPSANEVKYTFPAGTINFARLKVTGP